jgi:hypothetical protein
VKGIGCAETVVFLVNLQSTPNCNLFPLHIERSWICRSYRFGDRFETVAGLFVCDLSTLPVARLTERKTKTVVTCVSLTKTFTQLLTHCLPLVPYHGQQRPKSPGLQPDFHLISQTHQNLASGHQTLADELGKIPNLPQFHDPNVILDQLRRINDRLDGMNGRLDGMNERFDGIDDRLDTMAVSLQIR